MKKKLLPLLTALFPAFVSAASPVDPPQGLTVQNTLQNPSDLIKLIETIANWFFAILMVLAVIFILLAAFDYLSSGGGEKVAKAHKRLIYAAVAIAVAVASKGIVTVIRMLIGG